MQNEKPEIHKVFPGSILLSDEKSLAASSCRFNQSFLNLPGLAEEACRESCRKKGLAVLEKSRRLQSEVAQIIQSLL